MTGDAAGDNLTITEAGGLFRHNRFPGDPGFNSDSDFDTTVAGDQTIPSTSGIINIAAGDGNDSIVLGDGINLRGAIDGGAGIDTIDYAASTTAIARQPRARHHRVERDARRRPGESADHARRHGHRDGHQLQHRHPHVRHHRDRVRPAAGRRHRLPYSPGAGRRQRADHRRLHRRGPAASRRDRLHVHRDGPDAAERERGGLPGRRHLREHPHGGVPGRRHSRPALFSAATSTWRPARRPARPASPSSRT